MLSRDYNYFHPLYSYILFVHPRMLELVKHQILYPDITGYNFVQDSVTYSMSYGCLASLKIWPCSNIPLSNTFCCTFPHREREVFLYCTFHIRLEYEAIEVYCCDVCTLHQKALSLILFHHTIGNRWNSKFPPTLNHPFEVWRISQVVCKRDNWLPFNHLLLRTSSSPKIVFKGVV